MTENVLDLSDIAFRWPGQTRFSLSVPSFSVAQGRSVLLLGESGSGKSTLLSMICGTVLPDAGQVRVNQTDITQLPAGARDRFRAENIGVIFQQFNLLPFGTVEDNILLPLRFAPTRRAKANTSKATPKQLCAALGLPEEIISAKAERLSVGQQQRVAVARALIGHPPLIIADEPTSALDANSQAAFLDVLFDQTKTTQTSLLMVSHDARLGTHFDDVIELKDIVKSAEGMQ